MAVQVEEFAAFRTEVRHGFAYVNARLDTVDIELANVRSEIKEQSEQIRGLRSEIREQGEQLHNKLSKDLNDAVDAIMQAMERNYNEK